MKSGRSQEIDIPLVQGFVIVCPTTVFGFAVKVPRAGQLYIFQIENYAEVNLRRLTSRKLMTFVEADPYFHNWLMMDEL